MHGEIPLRLRFSTAAITFLSLPPERSFSRTVNGTIDGSGKNVVDAAGRTQGGHGRREGAAGSVLSVNAGGFVWWFLPRVLDTVRSCSTIGSFHGPSFGHWSFPAGSTRCPWDDFKQTSSPCKLLSTPWFFYIHTGYTVLRRALLSLRMYVRTRRKRSLTFFGPLAVANLYQIRLRRKWNGLLHRRRRHWITRCDRGARARGHLLRLRNNSGLRCYKNIRTILLIFLVRMLN